MKKAILFVLVVMAAVALQAQEQVTVPAEEPPQAQAQEPTPPGRELAKVAFPQAFVHAGSEYPAGSYWLALSERDGQSFFTVQNAQKEPLFEELAIVKPRRGGRTGSGLRLGKEMTKNREYFRIKVTTPQAWLLAYFLVKK